MHCSFCANEQLHHGKWRPLSAEDMYLRAADLVGHYSLDSVMFHDEDLFTNHKRVERMADLIGGRFEWWAQVRMDSVLRTDMHRLYDGGLRYVQAGVESGSPRILELINKRETRETMIEANLKLRDAHVKPLYNFMMGFPTETRDELMETCDLALRLLRDNPDAEMTGFYNYVPYPGTPLYPLAVEHGFREPQDLEGWATFTRQTLNPWQAGQEDFYMTVMTMSKFLDQTRMVRRMRESGEAGRAKAGVLRALSRLYRMRWAARDFDRPLEMKVTNWISRKLFGWGSR